MQAEAPPTLDRYAFADEMIKRAKSYRDRVLSGAEACGELERLAVERAERDLKNPAYYFDENRPDRVYQFFSLLRHSKGEWAGQQFLLAPWQAWIIWVVFGFVDVRNNFRRFRILYIQVARKNGKSTFLAGILLYMFRYDGEGGPEVYTAATKLEQAKIIFDESVRMVRKSRKLSQSINARAKARLVHEASDAVYLPLGADSKYMDGLNIHAAGVDELHKHKNRNVYDVITTGLGSRRQPLVASITTAGTEANVDTSVCYEQREHGEKILRQDYDDEQYFAFICEPDKGDDWKDPAIWRKGNPNLGVLIDEVDFANDCDRASRSLSQQNTFRRLRLDEWTEQAERWLDMDHWKDCPHDSQVDLSGMKCFGGLDLASTQDLTAFVLYFPVQPGLAVPALRSWFWCPRETVKAYGEAKRIPYDLWVKRGLVEPTEGNTTDYSIVEERVEEFSLRYNIVEVGYDPWNAGNTINVLTGKGIEMVRVPQTVGAFNFPSKQLEMKVLSHTVDHGQNSVLSFCAASVAVYRDGNDNIKPDRKRSSGKIDGIVAAIMAIGRESADEGDSESLYENKPLLTLQ